MTCAESDWRMTIPVSAVRSGVVRREQQPRHHDLIAIGEDVPDRARGEHPERATELRTAHAVDDGGHQRSIGMFAGPAI